MSTGSWTRRAWLSGVAVGVGCSSEPRDRGDRREPPVVGGPLADRFYQRAAAARWYIVGGSDFNQVAPGFPSFGLPPALGDPDPASSRPASLRYPKHLGDFDLSPDGERIAAMATRFAADSDQDERGDPHLIVFDRSFAVVHEDPGETKIGQRGRNTRSAMRWSPDGKLLAYAQAGAVWLYDPVSATRRSIADDHQVEFTFAGPSWISNSSLVYESADEQVVRVVLDTGARQVLGSGRYPQVSPDGLALVFRRADAAVCLIDPKQGRERELFQLQDAHDNYLWTPDSRYVLLSQKIWYSARSSAYVYDVEAGALIDLRAEIYTLKDRQIEALPRWLEARLLPVVRGE